MIKSNEKTLVIDPKSLYLSESDTFGLHPDKLQWLSVFQKGCFDRGLIQNVPTHSLKSLSFFYLAQVIKAKGIVEVLVDQPITVMQELDASEIETNAKLAGFSDIQLTNNETILNQSLQLQLKNDIF